MEFYETFSKADSFDQRLAMSKDILFDIYIVLIMLPELCYSWCTETMDPFQTTK